ncbi:MAG: hypothetical protein O3B65_02015 [Chloroflexi bacterium]|nr:hypothetical protein [Chloroflexota bacterium]
MVSSVFGKTEKQLIIWLKRVAAESPFDPEYTELRSTMPKEFPF